jgi:hypothetical protein
MRHAFSLLIKQSKLPLLSSALLGLCALPAQAVVFQAEDYSSYYDTSAGNSGGKYRSDNVDIENTNDTTGGTYNVGWIEPNEWLAYSNLVIPTTGSYTIKMRVVSPAGATAAVDLNGGSIPLGDMVIPAAGNWTNWTTVTKTVNLNAGTYSLGVFSKSTGWNFNWIEVVANSAPPSNLPTAYPGYTGVYSGYTLKLDERGHLGQR